MFSYITVLSNFIMGYDKYRRVYSKKNIQQSTFSNEFYLLKQDELNIGYKKAIKLLNKINLPNNLLFKIDTNPSTYNQEVFKNERNGLGYFINSNEIMIDKIYISKDIIDENNVIWEEISLENAAALSLQINNNTTYSYTELSPLTFSFLPVGIACQAKCKFCFSHSSISSEQIKSISDFSDLSKWMDYSISKGAKRFVITGGGDPGVWGLKNLLEVISLSKPKFQKTILFTNGIFLEKNKTDEEVINSLKLLKKSGLDTLSLSVHHYLSKTNSYIMGVNTQFERLINLSNQISLDEKPSIRLICVLQKGGIDSFNEIEKFIDFALKNNITEICFKELYVSSGYESLYSNLESNIYSEKNQISLKEVLNFAKFHDLVELKSLPWGSPIYQLNKDEKIIQFAAYTEPSLGWEISNGVARSWNYLTDKKCYTSLEDSNSSILLPNDNI